MAKTVTDVSCPFCGSLCDDLEVLVSDDGTKILEVYNACAIGAAKFLHHGRTDRVNRPRMRQEDGSYKEVSYDEAVEYTAQMLANAKKPLMYGWSRCQLRGAVDRERHRREGRRRSWTTPRRSATAPR